MNRQLVIKLRAELDIREARDWYERRREGLGTEFVLAIDGALAELAQSPHRCKEVAPGYRRGLVRRFPYTCFFRFDDQQVVVIGVYRSNRNPRRWKERIEKDRSDLAHE